MWNKDKMLARLSTDDAFMLRGLIALYQRQTADEQNSASTMHSNRQGFSAYTARQGTAIAKKAIANRYIGWTEMEIARNICRKHAGQLVTIANENLERKRQEELQEPDAAQARVEHRKHVELKRMTVEELQRYLEELNLQLRLLRAQRRAG